MAEAKNSFIKSKMNRDLDARLLPNGEYREGVNIQISKSEGADVGALENVLGNRSLIDFSSAEYTGVPNLHTIGMYTNNLDNNIYIFLTDYDERNLNEVIPDTNPVQYKTYNSQSLNYLQTANNFVYVYNTVTNIANQLVSGPFLNFSINFLINSVNLLEDILFWTDNRNQPRKINVTSALGSYTNSNGQTESYYTTEDQISVATYAPFQSIEVYYKDDAAFDTNGGSAVTSGVTAIGSTTILLTSDGFQGINPSTNNNAALTGSRLTTSTGVGLVANTVLASYVPTTITVAAGSVNAEIPSGTTIYFNQNTLLVSNSGQYVTSMIDANTPMNPGGTYNPAFSGNTTNRNYNPNFNGDPDFLEDKFVRFSYRFKYEDGENSIIAPFTQPTFIPKQDGYFLGEDENKAYRSTVVSFMENKVNNIFLQIPLPLKPTPVLRTLANGGTGLIYDSFNANEIGNALKVSEIEILYKESDSQAIQVVGSIPRSGNNGYEVLGRNPDGTFNTTWSYNYQGTKPYKTLPTSELIRVYDKVPVRAHGQEIISNRIVYSNFQNKHTPIASLDYNVGVSTKYLELIVNDDPGNPVLPPLQKTSSVEYPMHTIKQNRNYQVGVVLSDKFGRSSTTILSSASKQGVDISDTTLKFVGDTVYFPYNTVATTGITNNINAWPGDSLKILFNESIDNTTEPNPINGWPGVYNGDANSSNYNPLGWYSYKIVVKQTEQEYYNVYLPGILNGYPAAVTAPPDPVNTISTITLINDNINKVPRDLTEIGPDQKQFRSSVQLYGRVTPDNNGQPSFNKAYNPGIISDTVSSIGVQDQLLQAQAATLVDYIEIYQTDSNPSLARITQTDISNVIGSLPDTSGSTAYNIVLGIYETSPFESLIDIYYETSTTGTVVELNDAVSQQGSSSTKGFTTNTDMAIASDTWTFNLYEDIVPQTSVTATYSNGVYTPVNFFPYIADSAGLKAPIVNSEIATDETGFWVIDGEQNDATGKFELIAVTNTNPSITNPQSYLIKASSFFSYQTDSPVKDSYSFNLRVKNLDNPNPTPGTQTQFGSFTTITIVEKLINIIPTITCPNTLEIPIGQTGAIHTFEGENGSAYTQFNQENLTWRLESQSPATDVEGAVTLVIDENTGELSENTGRLVGEYQVEVSLTDAGDNATTLGGTPTATCITNINGSTGYDTESINSRFYQMKNITINKGPESSGFYWAPTSSDPVNPEISSTEPIPSNSVITSSTSTGLGFNTTNQTSLACNNWEFSNTNRNGNIGFLTRNSLESGLFGYTNSDGDPDVASSFGAFEINDSNSQQGLTSGSAYILVDYYQNNNNSLVQDNPSIIWPTFLEYRASSSDNWVTARDVEGKECKFGGTQINNYEMCPSDGVFTQNEGTKNKRNESTSPTVLSEGGFNQNDSFQTFLRNGSNDPIIKTAGSKLFVVGKNQGYRNLAGNVESDPNSVYPPDYMGEYRLVVRYPAGKNIPINDTNPIIPVLTPTTCPSPDSDYGNQANAESNQRVVLSFGDFYTPSQLIAEYGESGSSISPPSGVGIPDTQSFAYRVANQGEPTRQEAEEQGSNATILVYAREWAFRYVTQFYTDPELTTIWTPINASTTRWYSYRGFEDSYSTNVNGWQNINVKYGNENCNTRANGSPVFRDPVTNYLVGTSIFYAGQAARMWSAQFDPNGRKIIRTSEPCVASLSVPTSGGTGAGGNQEENGDDPGVPAPPVIRGDQIGGGPYTIKKLSDTSFACVFSRNSRNGNATGQMEQNAQKLAKSFMKDQNLFTGENIFYPVTGVISEPGEPVLLDLFYGKEGGLEAVDEEYAHICTINIGTLAKVEYRDDSTSGSGRATVTVKDCAGVPNLPVAAEQNSWLGWPVSDHLNFNLDYFRWETLTIH